MQQHDDDNRAKRARTSTTTTPSETLTFLLLDCCVTYESNQPPTIHLLGKSREGRNIHVTVRNFYNFFYAEPEKFSHEQLMAENGTVFVERVQRAPLYFYRQHGAMRDMFKVTYWFDNKKSRPIASVGRYEVEIKLRRRFMTELNLGAGCTVRITADAASNGVYECHWEQVLRITSPDEEIPASSTSLRVLAIDIQRVHHRDRQITSRCMVEKKDPIACIACCDQSRNTKVLFTLDDQRVSIDVSDDEYETGLRCHMLVECRSYDSELKLIEAFNQFLQTYDPDVILGWDIASALGTLNEILRMSRLEPQHLQIKTKIVTNYNASWVKRPNKRMSQTSNQQTCKITEGVEGRIVLDLLRTTTTKHKMQRYTLAESCNVFLADVLRRSSPELIEEIDQATLSKTWRDLEPGNRVRVEEYVFARSLACLSLAKKHSLVEETLQAGSTALLPISDVIYGAQMVRVHSLLLRKMRQTRHISAGSSDRSESVLEDPINAPFLINPEENRSQGLYSDEPVAVLDFQSLYPSIIIAFNLCYSTYVHESDRDAFQDIPPPRKTGSATAFLTSAPAYPETLAVERHLFVTSDVVRGVFPQLVSELLEQREQVKQRMAQLPMESDERIVLDQRQNQLKLCANATYGFSGATSASPLPFVSLAESVLRWGQAICRRSVQTINKLFPECRVIYGQTDSLFVSLGKGVSAVAAEAKARRIADEVTRSIGRPPVKLRFEKVYHPLLLCGVNRYAGRIIGTGEDRLDIVGLESESRKECALVRRIVRKVLSLALLDDLDPLQFLPSIMEEQVPRALPSDLVLTHALWRNNVKDQEEEEAITDQPHLAVARRLCSKDEDVSFVLGQRVAFILRTHPEYKRQAEKARDPFEEPDVAPDLTLYVKHKLLPPLGRIGRILDAHRWSELEAAWTRGRVWQLGILPRGARKCLGRSGCRLLTKQGDALCGRCSEEGLSGPARVHWEREANRLELQLHSITRDRHRTRYFQSIISREYSAIDQAYLANELTKLRTLMEERAW